MKQTVLQQSASVVSFSKLKQDGKWRPLEKERVRKLRFSPIGKSGTKRPCSPYRRKLFLVDTKVSKATNKCSFNNNESTKKVK